MLTQRFDQAPLSEFLPCTVERFGYAIRIECEDVSWQETALANGAIPFLEEPEDSARGIEPFKPAVAPEQKSGEVATICIPQAPQFIVIFGEEECGVGAVGRILVEKPIDGPQEALWLTQSERRERPAPVRCALVVQVRLQIGHQESSGNSFSRNVADHQPE